jgi:hypothetical protein
MQICKEFQVYQGKGKMFGGAADSTYAQAKFTNTRSSLYDIYSSNGKTYMHHTNLHKLLN